MLGKTLELVVSKDNPNFWSVDFFGNLDTYGLQQKRKDIMDLVEAIDKKYLAFNFANLDFINSEAISVLMQISEKLKAKGAKLALIGAKKNVVDVLNVIGIFEMIPYFKTMPDFLKNLENVH
jgi:anti-anti-sigma factor